MTTEVRTAPPPGTTASVTEARAVWLLMRRGLYEILRVPGAAIPGVLAPTIFVLGFTVAFGGLASLAGFATADYVSFVLPVGLLQGAGFSGGAIGVNLARDLEMGRFDRLLLSPTSRLSLLVGTILSASLRAMLPATLVLAAALVAGAGIVSLPLLVLAIAVTALFAVVAALYGVTLALNLQTQSAAPLMQAGLFAVVLTGSSYAPRPQLAPWLETIANVNPVTYVLELARLAFVEQADAGATIWPGLLALAGLLAGLSAIVALSLRRLAST